tara:strand:- start:13355 stop:14920 length:1566 start_codon:yes stop_codon:yes gene_type:complete
MGCTLTDQLIGNTFQSLIKTSDNCQLPATGQVLMSDGCGSDSSISIGKANQGLLVTGPINGGDITASGQLGGTVVTANTCITTTGDLFAAITAGNKVGIGTATPLEKLTVNGSLSANGDMHLDVGGIYACNGIGSNGNVLTSTGSQIQWTAGAAGGNFCGTVCGTGTQNTVTKFTNSTTIGDSIIQDDGTRVGIGTAPATYKLKVAGTVCSTRFTGPVTGNLTGNICGSTEVESGLTVNGTSNLVGTTTVGTINSTNKATLDDVEVQGAFCDCAGAQGSTTQYLKSTGTGVAWANLPSAGSGANATGTVCGTGTRIAKWDSADTIGDSAIYQTATRIGIGAAPDATCAFKVTGSSKFTGGICSGGGVTATSGVFGTGSVSAGSFTATGAGATVSSFAGVNSSAVINANGGLAASGSIIATGDIIAFSSSDKRLKENLTCITDSNNIINGLNNYCFDWNDKSEREGPGIGVIAQDVQKVLPNAVCERDNGDLAVDYNQFIPVLLQRVKELSAEVEDLKAKIS